MWRGGPRIWIGSIQSDEGDGPLEVFRDRLINFKFHDKDKGVDKAEFVLKNEDRYCLDLPHLRNGEKFLLAWGWADEMCIPRRMIVQKGGQTGTNFTVKAKDESVLMDRKRQFQSWSGAKDSDVVREIFAFNGYEGLLADIVETETVRETITQNRSDARMIQKLANRNGYVWWIDAAGAHFTPRPMASEPTKWFTYRGYYDGDGYLISEPQIDANLSKDLAKVRVSAIDPYTHEEVFAEAGAADEEETLGEHIARHIASLGEEQEVGDPDNPVGNRQARISRQESVNLGIATQQEVTEAAEAMYREVAGGRYKMNVSIRGEPLLGAKMLIGLREYAEAFDGLYYVKEAITFIGNGTYKQDLVTRRDALGKIHSKNILKIKKKKNEPEDNKEPPPKESLERVAVWGIGDNNEPVKMWAYVDKQGESHYWDQMTPTEASQNQLPGI